MDDPPIFYLQGGESRRGLVMERDKNACIGKFVLNFDNIIDAVEF